MPAEWLDLFLVSLLCCWLARAADAISSGAVVAYPTDSSYVLGCRLGDKDAAERISTIRGFDGRHLFTLICRDLSEIATYARVDNRQYRLLKSVTPGPYTFVLEATRELPRRLQHEKRKTIGIRIPNHPVPLALLELLGAPLISTTLWLPGEEEPIGDVAERRKVVSGLVDVVL